jgi:hypothetical protein
MSVKHLQDLSALVDKLYTGQHQPTEEEIYFIVDRVVC